MKAGLFLISIFLLLDSCLTVKSNNRFTYKKLPIKEYYATLQQTPDRYIIDVRTPAEYRKNHAHGALNYDFLAFHFAEDVDSLDRNKPAFIYCYTCHRSPFAAKIMKKKGFTTVYDLKGGFYNWMKADLPTDKGETK